MLSSSWNRAALQFVEEVVQGWNALLQSLALPCVCDNHTRLGGSIERISTEDLPVIKDALWECLATSVRSQVSRKSEELVDRKVSFDNEHWCSNDTVLLNHMSSSSVE